MALLELGELGEAGGLVDRVADDGVFEPGLSADVPGDGAPGGHADAELHVEAQHVDELVVQLAGGRQRGARRVGMLDRCAEDGQRGVALEFVDEATVAVDGVDDDAEELVEQIDDIGRRAGGGQLRRTHQVDEQHCDVAFLTAELGPAFQGTTGDVLADVAAEKVTQPLPLGQVANHVVESGLQQAQFAGVVDLHVGVVVTSLHFAQRPTQLAQWIGDRHRHQHRARQTDQQRGDGQHQDRRDQPVGRSGENLKLARYQCQHDRQDRHAGGQHPGQHLAQDDAGRAIVLRHPTAKCGDRDGPQHPFGLQIADDRRRGRAQRGCHGDDRCRTACDRPTGDDEDDGAQAPVGDADDGAVVRHLQRAGAGQLGGGGVAGGEQGVAPLPAHHRDQQPQADEGADGEGEEQVAQKDGEVERRQVLKLDAVLRR